MISDLYNERRQQDSDIAGHLEYLAELVVELNAKKVIELGVRGGNSTTAWLHGLEKTGGHLWSVDPIPENDFDHTQWTLIVGDDRDPNVLAQLPDVVDVVFIDTDHLYEHTLTELGLYADRVRSGGRIVLHDTELASVENEEPYPVKRAVTLFCESRGWKWTNREHCYGLGTIEVT